MLIDSTDSADSGLIRVRLPYARVLVVDDTAANLAAARSVLKLYSMSVDCVNSGQKAVGLIRKAEVRYNAVFMDQMMPEMDGIEAVRIIRGEIGSEYAKTVPIIALTANAEEGGDMFLKNGFQAFLSKPIDIMALDAVVRRWVQDKSQEPSPASVPGPAETGNTVASSIFAGMEIRGVDFEGALRRFGGSENIYLDILKAYVQSTQTLLSKLRFVSADTLAEYAVTIHGIKGGSRNIGAESLGAEAEALEKAAKAGDLATVSGKTQVFIEAAQALLVSLAALLAKNAPRALKPKRAPDPALLAKLMEACNTFDMDGVDRAMEQLNQYEYEKDADLVAWLNGQTAVAAFKEIADRLAELQGSKSL